LGAVVELVTDLVEAHQDQADQVAVAQAATLTAKMDYLA
jgi:hypothetical protein